MANTVDFDAMLAEVEAGPASVATFTFKFLGKDWELPQSPPAKDMLQLRKLYMLAAELQVKQDTGRLSEKDADAILQATESADYAKMLGLMVGAEIVAEWLKSEVTDSQLQHLTKYFWNRYNGKEPRTLVGDGVGEVQAPIKGRHVRPSESTSAPNPSQDGQPSSQISPATTESHQQISEG